MDNNNKFDLSQLQDIISQKRNKLLAEHIENADDELESEQALLEYKSMMLMVQSAYLDQIEENMLLRMEVLQLKEQLVQMQVQKQGGTVPNALGI